MDKDTYNRLVKEHDELNVRLEKLREFRSTETYTSLSHEEKELLEWQYVGMIIYNDGLARRIAYYKKSQPKSTSRFEKIVSDYITNKDYQNIGKMYCCVTSCKNCPLESECVEGLYDPLTMYSKLGEEICKEETNG